MKRNDAAGIYLEIYTHAKYFDPDAFELRSHGIIIAAVSPVVDDELRVVIFVPYAALDSFRAALDKYRAENTPDGNPRQANRFERFDRIALGSARSLWTDKPSSFPPANISTWWEVWLFAHREVQFLQAAASRDILVREARLEYPEVVVRLAYGRAEDFDAVIRYTDAISELRSAPTTPAAITRLPVDLQQELLTGATNKLLTLPANAATLCLLDSGVNEGHPVLSTVASSSDVHAWNSSWGTQDDENHGTPMASLALFGDLLPSLTTTAPLQPAARLESVKIYGGESADVTPELQGVVARDSVAIVESAQSERSRFFVSAVSMPDEGNSGLPTEWSSELDALAAATPRRRLFILAAGNVDSTDRCVVADYPGANWVRPLYEPAQAYNVVSVGGYTERAQSLDPPYEDYEALAPVGALSPVSRTGVLWVDNPLVPIKPDIVMEAGNFAAAPNAMEAEVIDDYLVLAANADFRTNLYRTFGYTSGAAALAGRLAAQIMSDQRDLWPETVRGLLVHSAEWSSCHR